MAARLTQCVATGVDPSAAGAKGERQKQLALKAVLTEGIQYSSYMKVILTVSS